jgi:thiol-disulfide isomerase/thioredoxin
MVKEEVQEAVVEEAEVATEVAEAVKTAKETKEDTTTTDETTDGDQEELSPWYVFCSTGCGFCKKAEPVIEELIEEGHDILILDMAEPDNQKLNQELQTEYNTKCGTPWFINAETGKGVCGFREKDVLEKWLAGEDIPVPPRPTGPPPRPPYHGSTGKEDTAWKKEYTKWVKDNKHMPDTWQKQQKSASAVLDNPRPKSDPPRPPMGPQMAQATDADFDKWGAEMKVWQEENKHLPNLQPVDNMVQQMKSRRTQMAQGGPGGPGAPGAPGAPSAPVSPRLATLEAKVDRLMAHLGVK